MFNWFKNETKEVLKPKEIKCPYCSFVLEKMPTRKQKCKSCNNEYLVRTHYITKEKIILTDKEAISYDKEKEKYYIDKSLVDGLKLHIDVDKEKIDKLVKITTKELTEKFGKPASLGDVAWSVSNKMVMEAIKDNDLNMLSFLYFQMSLYLYESGRDYRELKAKSFELDLLNYKKSEVVTKIEVLATNESCEHCKSLNGTIYSIKEALEKKILPCKECSYQINEKSGLGWCRCCYAPNVD